MNQPPASNKNRTLIMVLFCLGLLRLVSLGLYPLADTTEARYAEIARLMTISGNWITPQIDMGVPFWGKPPLSTWLSALSFNIFGVNEFAARLPSFLLAVAVVGLIYCWAQHLKGKTYALYAAVVLATSAVFFISSGAVMTDPALLLGTTLSMVGFYRAVNQKLFSRRIWGYWFFVGLALSMLAKGPVGLVLTLAPIGGWVLYQRCWRETWQRLPWIKGVLLAMALSLPWYILAERQTPGFLEYFLVGEHWRRFVDAGWKGDLYGHAHSRPRGTIWYYWLASALPWSLIAIGYFFSSRWRRQALSDLRKKPALTSYLLLWTLAPMLFFTAAGNILWTYVLPGMPAFAMLMALLWNQPSNSDNGLWYQRSAIFSKVAIGTTILFAASLLLMSSNLLPKRKCQKELVEAYE
ncbi:MAG: glycosyltransferase family 39 protein, partial [Candidatus Marinimicrobia bacterium]|nr:glycosyltransferase family 39 protein [Candidatus Neomarinimicrobiota bacterium]